MAVPLLDLKLQSSSLEEELNNAFLRVLRSGHYILGPEVEQFEAASAKFLGLPHALAVSSGTDAILLALMALEIGPGDEVLCPSFTFFATAGCVARVGATPVFVDCCPGCFNISPTEIRKSITPNTKAIIPVHLFGQAAEMDQIIQLAREFDLWVIEDAAQSFGALYKDESVGLMGDFGCFSFFPTKNLGAIGDAGLLTTSNPELAERAQILRVHGSKPKYVHHFIGANFRIDALQAAFLNVKLPHTPTYLEKRTANARRYTAGLSNSNADFRQGGVCSCDGVAEPVETKPIRLPFERRSCTHTWNQYSLLVRNGKRDALRDHLANLKVGSEVYYPIPLHEQVCFNQFAANRQFPVSTALSREVLSLPIFPELKPEQIDEVIAAVSSFLKN